MRDLVALMRPWQWSKNGIVFAGMIFSRHLFDSGFALRALLAVAVFCLASSAIYAINDIRDVGRDRLHPDKQDRPLASGRMRPAGAWGIAAVLLALSGAGAAVLGSAFVVTLAVFVVLNVLYSFALKNLVVLDVMSIALSFVTRAVAGVMALRPLDPSLELSPWLLVCTLFLALYLGFGKRRHELSLLEAGAGDHRSALKQYSLPLLDQLISIVTAATLIAYAIYTVAPETVAKFHTTRLVLTVPIVAYGIFRYLYLILNQGKGGNPSRLLYQDAPLLITIGVWLASVGLILYADRF